MRLHLPSLVVVLLAVQGAAAVAPGDKVVVIKPTELKSLSGAVSKPMPGSTLTVRSVEGDRLKVSGGRVGWIESANVLAAKTADAYFTDLIQRDSNDAAALLGRGRLRFDLGDKERAIADLDACLRIAPNSDAIAVRGFAWKRQGNSEKAMADFDEAIRLDPKNALAWRVRGATWAGRGDYAKAVAEYSESIRLDPENPESLHHRAVMLAACEEDPIRNGKQSLLDATRACELTEWQDHLFLNGLVTAYAELGDFDQALRQQEQVIALTGQGKERLAQLREHKPFRNSWKK